MRYSMYIPLSKQQTVKRIDDSYDFFQLPQIFKHSSKSPMINLRVGQRLGGRPRNLREHCSMISSISFDPIPSVFWLDRIGKVI